ncbi:Rieske (2Fe-2S) protein [Bradyrhizobium daqingense]|uniref:3-phenylpropionate/trans-cinnamate dioxygenase ferredoxin subunit/naphthalene 1,2-dioxygenase system ferredoxin subunit n=1 Tax=Bradyrhizobium daqingense TaxID=993502 RepID=A0A562KVZ6_9BRAD|nr:Rieske (2Fe-2S) protein [Bradyrhizobium daqingense]TWH99589.1 3-phenylpropionate/trans-cinnamate dioxygenase ferredoxin subunit/naphthalene 1,2-dioxygenase system ferredoxin subunit [Bradyrhizobium daqingense]UFS85938.1 Rieske (2Fe-2S) protein [Bradyrhizobium daqingense]
MDEDAAASAGVGWTPVCNLDRLRADTIIRVNVASLDLLVIWNDGNVVACDRACPHEQADLALGEVRAGRLFCPRHAASFDLRDGAIDRGWPSPPLRLYPIRITGGQICVDAREQQAPR